MRTSVIAASLLLLSTSGLAAGAESTPPTTSQDEQLPNTVNLQDLAAAQTLLTKVAATLDRSRSDAKMQGLMRQAKAVFVVPEFGHATAVPGSHWGAGVLLEDNNGHWSDPIFYSLGGGSLGQTVANGGALMLFIMNDRGLARFQGASGWSLNSGPGTAIANYSASTPQDLSGTGADIVAWSASGGPHSETQVSINDIAFDAASNSAVYGTTDLRNIVARHTPYLNPAVISLVRQMPSATANASIQKRATDRG